MTGARETTNEKQSKHVVLLGSLKRQQVCSRSVNHPFVLKQTSSSENKVWSYFLICTDVEGSGITPLIYLLCSLLSGNTGGRSCPTTMGRSRRWTLWPLRGKTPCRGRTMASRGSARISPPSPLLSEGGLDGETSPLWRTRVWAGRKMEWW